ncbi:ion transporter [Ekhidna sp. To15]|uniref:ion transporter n=1 Tax=Ekhidna sp. To15 TaxID=3395267 RepID=UPI003F51C06B
MHLLTISYAGTLRDSLRVFFESQVFQTVITSIIIVNSILIGLETSEAIMVSYGRIIDVIDLTILVLFSIEIFLKIFVYRIGFFKNSWNVFDFLVVAISLVPAAGSFSVFRALRIVRTLRILRSIPKLRLIIESLVKSLPSIGWIAVLLGIVFYVFSVIGVNLFGDLYPKYFGDMSKAIFTLFQIMTLESWSSAIARPVMDGVPFAGVYFITFILIATYTTLNIFIAIVVNTMNEVSLKDLKEEEEHIKDFVSEENRKLQEQLRHIQSQLEEIKVIQQ